MTGPLQVTPQNGRVGHAGAGSSGTLGNRGSVEDQRFFHSWGQRRDQRVFGKTKLQRLDAVAQRQVHHVGALAGIDAVYHLILVGHIGWLHDLKPSPVTLIVPRVEIQSAFGRGGHTRLGQRLGGG